MGDNMIAVMVAGQRDEWEGRKVQKPSRQYVVCAACGKRVRRGRLGQHIRRECSVHVRCESW